MKHSPGCFDYKISFKKYKNYIVQSIFSDQNLIKLEIYSKKMYEKFSNMWKLNI